MILSIIDNIVNESNYIRWQEWVSTLMQIVSVWYARQNNILVYPTGIIGVVLAAWVYFFLASPPLYADGTLNVYYFIMSIYGWYIWSDKKDVHSRAFPISWCTRSERRYGIYILIASFGCIYLILTNWTNSDVPILDSLVSATAMTAMWWMAKRKIEHWIAWIISNIIAIPLNIYKGFIIFAIMYCLFLILSISGFKAWKNQLIKPAN